MALEHWPTVLKVGAARAGRSLAKPRLQIMARRGWLALVLLVPVSCTTVWVPPPGKEGEERRRDFYECERDMRQSGYFANQYDASEFMDRCLEARGYSWYWDPWLW